MIERFKQGLLEQHESLDIKEDSALPDWLAEKHKSTLQRQGADETLRIATKDVQKYLSLKATFLQELRRLGLNLEKAEESSFALKLWNDCGYRILVQNCDVYHAVEEAEQRVSDYLEGQTSAPPSMADAGMLTSRFDQQDSERTINFTEKQREFLIALSEFVSRVAQLDYRILKFRRDVLGGSENTISHEDATNLVRSPAAQYLSIDFFTESGTPVVGHTVERMPVEHAPHMLYVEPPPQFVDATEVSKKLVSLRWIGTNSVLEEHSVAESSLLGELQKLCKHLARHHPTTEELAAYLVLCGSTIQLPSLASRITDKHNAKIGGYVYDYSTITLTVASWITPEQVRQAYARLRAQASAKNTYRSKSDRNVALFRFVMEKAEPISPKDLIPGTRGTFKFPPWREMVKKWNEPLPKDHRWRFNQSGYTAEKMFRSAFADGYEAVTGQKYYAAKPLVTKEEMREEADNSREAWKKYQPPEQTGC